MVVTIDDVHRLEGADVYDSKGERVGKVRGPHVLDGELVGLHVDVDKRLADLPNVEVDEVEFDPDSIEVSGENSVRLRRDFMDAVRRPAGGR